MLVLAVYAKFTSTIGFIIIAQTGMSAAAVDYFTVFRITNPRNMAISTSFSKFAITIVLKLTNVFNCHLDF